MSQERISLIERTLDAWNRRSSEEILTLTTPDAVYVNPPDALEPGIRTGHEGLRIVWEKQWEMLGDARLKVEALHERGDHVITVSRMSRTLHGSPMPLEVRGAMRWSFREGRISKLEILGVGSSLKTALEAAGIAE